MKYQLLTNLKVIIKEEDKHMLSSFLTRFFVYVPYVPIYFHNYICV